MKYIQSPPISFLSTNIHRSSSGHNFHNWITGLFLSKLFDLEYVYSPFTGDSTRYDSFLNLHTLYPTPDQINPTSIIELGTPEFCHNEELDHSHYYRSIEHIKNIIENSPDGTLFKLGYNPFPGLLTQYYFKITEELQQAYWSLDRDIKLKFIEDKISVAIHIRRGDVSRNGNPDRWLDIDYYANVIDKLNSGLGIQLLDIHIFSEGQPKDFESLIRDNVTLQLGGFDLEALHHMCSADILVTGQSTFSIMASYFNKGITLFTPLKNFMYKWESEHKVNINEINFNSLKEKLNVK